jgi:ABC-type sugar transport system ATPase subunit
MDLIVNARDMCKSYPGNEVLHNVDFQVNKLDIMLAIWW